MKSHAPRSRTPALLRPFLLISLLLSLVGCHDSEKWYNVSGQITGLNASGLVLANNGATPLSVAAGSNSFALPDRYRRGTPYDVTVATQPEGQVCTVTNGTGTLNQSVSDIQIACVAETHLVVGAITGLNADGLVVQLNGANDIELAADAKSFEFTTPMTVGSEYHVTVLAQPQWQICTVTNGAGTVHHTIADIQIMCAAETHTVAGSVAGLTADGLVLQLNGADDLAVPSSNGTFEFATPIAAGSSYQVTVLTQPPGLACAVNNGAAANINADISNVQVVCSATSHTIGGSVGILSGAGLILQNNGTDDLAVPNGSTSFQFASVVADGGTYNVTVLAQPAGQICSVLNGSGTALSDVINVAVLCTAVPSYMILPVGGANGSISPNTPQNVNQGDSIGFVATPNVGYAVAQWLVDAVPVQSGGNTYTLTNVSANHTVQVTFGVSALSVSTSDLALSVNDPSTNAALTGSARSITVTNIGSITATNLSISLPSLPVGTVVSANTCGSTLASSNSCSITITPGANASSSCTSGAAATPGTLTVSADNVSDINVNVVVLGYGCIYQGGYVFAVDDTTPSTTSIGGKIAATSDQAPYPNGAIWASNGTGGAAGNMDAFDVGVAQNDVTPCVSNEDGACNSTQILSHYPAPPYSRAYFAAGLCTATINSYSDWYLPASCEANRCGVGQQNMQDNLVAHNGLNLLAGYYWTSTEYAPDPQYFAMSAHFAPVVGFPWSTSKGSEFGVRCVRKLSQ